MASPEQIAKRLRETLKTSDDAKEFVGKWGGGYEHDASWSDETFVAKNIDRIVDQAFRKGLLNQLGMRLGFPSEQHAAYIRTIWTDRRSWAALLVSVIAWAASIFALINKD